MGTCWAGARWGACLAACRGTGAGYRGEVGEDPGESFRPCLEVVDLCLFSLEKKNVSYNNVIKLQICGGKPVVLIT